MCIFNFEPTILLFTYYEFFVNLRNLSYDSRVKTCDGSFIYVSTHAKRTINTLKSVIRVSQIKRI